MRREIEALIRQARLQLATSGAIAVDLYAKLRAAGIVVPRLEDQLMRQGA